MKAQLRLCSSLQHREPNLPRGLPDYSPAFTDTQELPAMPLCSLPSCNTSSRGSPSGQDSGVSAPSKLLQSRLANISHPQAPPLRFGIHSLVACPSSRPPAVQGWGNKKPLQRLQPHRQLYQPHRDGEQQRMHSGHHHLSGATYSGFQQRSGIMPAALVPHSLSSGTSKASSSTSC